MSESPGTQLKSIKDLFSLLQERRARSQEAFRVSQKGSWRGFAGVGTVLNGSKEELGKSLPGLVLTLCLVLE